MAEQKKSSAKAMILPPLVLAVICAVCCAFLALANMVTKDKIAAAEADAIQSSLHDPDVPDPDDPGKDQITVTGLGETYNLPLSEGQKVLVNISAPKGITKLLVKIDSDNEEFMATLGGFGLAEEFDIANPGKLFDVLSNSLESGNGIGLIDPDDPIKGKTSYLFDVTDFMVLLNLYAPSTNTFTLTVEDGVSEPVSGTLTVVASNLE